MIFGNRIDLLSKMKNLHLVTDASTNIAEFLCGLEKNLTSGEKQSLALTYALLSEWVSSGSICLTKSNIETFYETNKEVLSGIGFPDWQEIKNLLAKSSCCTQDPKCEEKPLVLSDEKIYFYKYWFYEESLAAKVLELSKLPGKYTEKGLPIKNVFGKLFKDPKSIEQKNAAETVIRNRFSVITGGPGTGKTTTVAKIIAGILSVYPEERILLAAPTGKAAARMTEALKDSVEDKKGRNNFKEISQDIRSKILSFEGQTIHRILNKNFGKAEKNRENPICADLIIIDEASMVDIALFSEVLDALSDETSLILLGDKDQLASVDAGNVLADICANRELLPGGTVSELKTSHRFDEHPGIGKLAKAVNEQKSVGEVIKICKEEADLAFTTKTVQEITGKAKEQYGFLSDTNLKPEEILYKLNGFKILCPSKEDFYGVENINREIEAALAVNTTDAFYNGRPIMITKNDYTNNLMNGDCGVILKKKAWFMQGNELRQFNISELPAFETVYAMTIHKSQGSEYGSVLVVLPEKDMPMLTKELLYTAITRAKAKVEITAKESVMEYTLKNSAARNSGFENALKKLKESNEE